jgi:Protein of unknown function (DUF1631)
MQETEYKRLIQAAKDRAMFGFLALVQRAMQDADKDLVQKLAEAKSNLDQTTLSAVRHFLRQDGNQFLRRVDVLYRNYLDRAMQTMYVDFRPGMKKMSANELSLIDDEVVNHQIEVGRLAHRMREENEESIGRLNVIVAQMHGQSEVRERENPFRPYLLARPIYEAIKEIATDEQKAKALFEFLASALVEHLPGYYTAVREVFEASGVRGKFVAMRSRAAHNQRYFGAAPMDPNAASAQLSTRVMPGLQRMFDTLAQGPADPIASARDDAAPATVDEFIRKMFSPSKSLLRGPAARETPPLNPLIAQLNGFQKLAAAGQPVDAGAPQEQNQLFALRERLDLGKASMMERLTVDVVAMLFEYIVEDRQIPAELRRSICGLQIPVLKTAMLQPELLHDDRHPARELLNRLSSAAIGVDTATDAGKALAAETGRIVHQVLEKFDTDCGIYVTCLQEFEQFMAHHLRQDDAATVLGIEAVEAAEKISVLLTNTTAALCDVLLPLNIDKRISDFAIHIWPHVLVQSAWLDAQHGRSAEHAESLYRQYHAVLPELVWSVQEKQDAQERATLIRMLAGLVKRINAALRLIQMPEEDGKLLLDQLVAMHTQVLRPVQKSSATNLRSLDELRQDFARLSINWDRVTWALDEPPPARDAVIEEALLRKGITASINMGQKSLASTDADREFLEQTYLLGTRVELRGADGGSVPAQLVWITAHRSLYLFKQDKEGGEGGDGALVIHTAPSLLEALRAGSVFPVEYAPVFERAVESLLYSAEKLQTD